MTSRRGKSGCKSDRHLLKGSVPPPTFQNLSSFFIITDHQHHTIMACLHLSSSKPPLRANIDRLAVTFSPPPMAVTLFSTAYGLQRPFGHLAFEPASGLPLHHVYWSGRAFPSFPWVLSACHRLYVNSCSQSSIMLTAHSFRLRHSSPGPRTVRTSPRRPAAVHMQT